MPLQLHPNALDLIGFRSGKLVAIEPISKKHNMNTGMVKTH